MSRNTIAALVLAAGKSSRFENGHKLKTTWKGKPLIQSVLDEILSLQLTTLKVVVSPEIEEQIPTEVSRHTTMNKESHLGLSHSLKIGIQELAEESIDGILICLADMPLLKKSHYTSLMDTFKNSHKDVVIPKGHEQRGNPICVSKDFALKVLPFLKGDQGLRSVLHDHTDCVEFFMTEEKAYFFDLDTKADLENIKP